jgi:hypothetical protein
MECRLRIKLLVLITLLGCTACAQIKRVDYTDLADNPCETTKVRPDWYSAESFTACIEPTGGFAKLLPADQRDWSVTVTKDSLTPKTIPTRVGLITTPPETASNTAPASVIAPPAPLPASQPPSQIVYVDTHHTDASIFAGAAAVVAAAISVMTF